MPLKNPMVKILQFILQILYIINRLMN